MNSSVVFSVRDQRLRCRSRLRGASCAGLDLALHVFEARLRLLQQQVGAAFGFADDQRRLRSARVP